MGRWAWIVLGAVVAVPSVAAAEPPRARLVMGAHVPAGCPDAWAMRMAVAQRLGYDGLAADEGDAELVVELELARRGRGHRARIVLRGGGGAVLGERTLASRSSGCAEVADAAALAIAIAIDPAAALALPPAQPPTTTAVGVAPPVILVRRAPWPASSPPPPPAHAAEPAATAAVRAPWRWHARVGLVGSVGVAPSAVPGVSLGAGAARGWLGVDVEARLDLAASETVASGTVSAGLSVASVVPCARWRRARACALVSAGVVRGQGDELPEARAVRAPFLGAGARLAWEQPVAGAWSVAAHADVVGALARVTLEVGDMQVWAMPAWSASVGVAAVGTIP